MAENKRKAGRPPKNATPAKRAKAATPAKVATPKEQTPVVEAVEPEREPTPLPSRITESKTLPTLSEPQRLDLPDDEYQSIRASGVLAASLERSRLKWVSGSFLDKYWTKTSTRKDAPPPPANNPQRAWMKEIGPCTITIEPLILEANVFYVKEPGMPALVSYNQPAQQRQQPVQYQTPSHPAPLTAQPPAPSPYGTPYRPQPAYQTPGQNPPFYQGRPLPPSAQPSPMPTGSDNRTLPPMMPANGHPAQVAPRTLPSPTPAPSQQSKAQPDPVVQMLATRASSDHELKSLMKVVATGHANQDQLRIFQRHIDELTAIMNRNKAQAQAQQQQQQQQQRPPQQYVPHQQQQQQQYQYQTNPQTPSQHGAHGTSAPSRTSTPGISGPQQILPRPGPAVTATPPPPHYQQPQQQQPHPHQQQPQQQRHPNQYTSQSHQPKIKAQPQPPIQKHYPPHQQPKLPVVLEFQGPGASPDRFRFPEYSVLEFLSPYMLLASFLVIRKSDSNTAKDNNPKEKVQATDGEAPESNAEPQSPEIKDKDIYEPITLKIQVDETQKGRDLLEFIRRSVKPPVETVAWMIEQIGRCTRAERRHLALRLPRKSQMPEPSEDSTKESTPAVVEKKKAAPRKSMDKKAKEKEEEGIVKEGEKTDVGALGQDKGTGEGGDAAAVTAPSAPLTETDTQQAHATEGAAAEVAAPALASRRSSRKKGVRTSDVQTTDA